MKTPKPQGHLMDIRFDRLFYVMCCFGGGLALLYFGSIFLIPIAMALLISLILYPVCLWIESFRIGRVLATVIVLVLVLALVSGIFIVSSKEIASIVRGLSDFEIKLKDISNAVISFLNDRVSILPRIDQNDVVDQGHEMVKKSGGSIVTNTLSQTGHIISGFVMTLVYTFLLLIYRSGLKKTAKQFAGDSDRDAIENMIMEIQKVGKNYLLGMSIMILILGTTNAIVLLVFGLDNAIFFGFLAAFLAIIPYVGTLTGAMIPVIYAFMTTDSLWTPLGIALSFWLIQFIESNFLTPRIVGGNLNLNALAAIVALILGGYLWGVAGMVLFLPLTAMFRVFCSYYQPLLPVSNLLGDELKSRDLNS